MFFREKTLYIGGKSNGNPASLSANSNSGYVVVGSDDSVFGDVVSIVGRNKVLAIRNIDNVEYLFEVDKKGGLVTVDGLAKIDFYDYFYESNDCSGQPYYESGDVTAGYFPLLTLLDGFDDIYTPDVDAVIEVSINSVLAFCPFPESPQCCSTTGPATLDVFPLKFLFNRKDFKGPFRLEPK